MDPYEAWAERSEEFWKERAEKMCEHIFEFIHNNKDEKVLVCDDCGKSLTLEELTHRAYTRLELLKRCSKTLFAIETHITEIDRFDPSLLDELLKEIHGSARSRA